MTEDLSLIIGKDGVKRELAFPFNICISRESLEVLFCALRVAREGHTYGWISVAVPEPLIPDTMPISWGRAITDEEHEALLERS